MSWAHAKLCSNLKWGYHAGAALILTADCRQTAACHAVLVLNITGPLATLAMSVNFTPIPTQQTPVKSKVPPFANIWCAAILWIEPDRASESWSKLCSETFRFKHSSVFKISTWIGWFLQNWWIINEAVEVYDHLPAAIKADLSEKVSMVVFSSWCCHC